MCLKRGGEVGYLRKAIDDFVSMIKDLLKILSWKETWVLPIASLGIVGAWLLFAYSLTLPTPIRAVIIWGIVLGLSILAPKK